MTTYIQARPSSGHKTHAVVPQLAYPQHPNTWSKRVMGSKGLCGISGRDQWGSPTLLAEITTDGDYVPFDAHEETPTDDVPQRKVCETCVRRLKKIIETGKTAAELWPRKEQPTQKKRKKQPTRFKPGSRRAYYVVTGKSEPNPMSEIDVGAVLISDLQGPRGEWTFFNTTTGEESWLVGKLLGYARVNDDGETCTPEPKLQSVLDEMKAALGKQSLI
ncbi:hypothetical protein [Lysinibacter cavernae]|uniref:hypothetical protein n=1 Tax=Lysinibacter cavernae TaxID=1640652 RepID=UPI0036218559